MKKILIGSITFFLLKYKITKIVNEKEINVDEKKKKESKNNKILKFLQSKNINTDDLSNNVLESMYWVERIKDGGLILLNRHEFVKAE